MEKILNTGVSSARLDTQSIEYRTLMAYFSCAAMEIETKFNVLNEEFSLQHDRNPIASVKTRWRYVWLAHYLPC